MTANLLDCPISLVKGNDTAIIAHRNVNDFFAFIGQPTAEYRTQSDEIADWAKNNPAKYRKAKANLYGFMMGKFSIRANDGLEEYTPIITFDIDGISKKEKLEEIFSLIPTSPYILAAFPSPSRKGLRVFVWADSIVRKGNNINAWKEEQAALHKAYHAAIIPHLCEVLGVSTRKKLMQDWNMKKLSKEEKNRKIYYHPHIDTGVKAMGQHYYFTAQPDMFYVNTSAKMWTHLPVKQSSPAPFVETVKNHKNGDNYTDFSDRQKLDLIHAIVDNRGYARNNSTFGIACNAAEFGIDEGVCLAYCSNKYVGNKPHPFTQHQCTKTVRDGYERADFGSKNTPQLVAYAKKALGDARFFEIIRKDMPLQTKPTMNVPTGTIRMWVLFDDESGKFYKKKKNTKTPAMTFLSQSQSNAISSEFIQIIGNLSNFLAKFESDWDYRLKIKYIVFNPLKDPKTVYFKCRPSGVISEVNDTALMDKLIADKVVQIDQRGKKVLIPLYNEQKKITTRTEGGKAMAR